MGSNGLKVNENSYENEHVDNSRGVEMGVRSAACGTRTWVGSVMSNVISGEGQIFESANAFRSCLYKYSIACEFRYKWVKNTKTRLIVKCSLEDCPFIIKAYAIRNTSLVKIREFNDSHQHKVGDICALHKPPFSSKLVGGLILGKIRSTSNYRPNEVRKDIERDTGIQINYAQAWSAVECAKSYIHGDPKDHYKMLDWICDRVKKSNPGSVAFVVVEDCKFSQLFISFASCMQGFLFGCRPCIFVDAGHLSGPFGGTMLSACTVDADNRILPLAIGIVSCENYDNWHWFLKQLKLIIRSLEVVVLSDRHPGIISSVAEIFGEENHCFCLRHLKENFNSELMKLGITRRVMKENASDLFDAIAYANTDVDFNMCMANLEAFNTKLAEWVKNTKPEHWARSKFPKPRWTWMNSNIAESFNSWMRNERGFSIPSLLLAYFDKLATKMLNVKNEICRWQTPIGPSIEKILYCNYMKRSCVMRSIRYSHLMFKVEIMAAQLTVDLNKRTCSCGEWQVTGIPCAHVCYVLDQLKYSLYDYTDSFYKKEAQELIYQNSINPVETHELPSLEPTTGMLIIKDGDDYEGSNLCILPPIVKKTPGRPKTRRIESQFQDMSSVHCSRCGEAKHNRRTCRSQVICNRDELPDA